MLEEVSLLAQRNALVSFQGKLSSLKENHRPFPGHEGPNNNYLVNFDQICQSCSSLFYSNKREMQMKYILSKTISV